jgi:hypothetical protein
MGHRTSNLSLYVPDVGETGWGEEVGGNFETLDAVSSGSAFGASAVRRLIGANNNALPNTRYDLSANLIVVRNPATGLIATMPVPGLTIDFATSGPGGLDTGAQTANTWYHLYFIWSGTTLVGVASLGAPPTGPTLMPATYTYWGYAGPVRSDGANALIRMRMFGAGVFYDVEQFAQSAAVPDNNVEHTVNVALSVPPNALSFRLNTSFYAKLTVEGASTLRHRVFPGSNAVSTKIISLANGYAVASPQLTLPNVGQQYFWLFNLGSGAITSGDLTESVAGFRIANGDS